MPFLAAAEQGDEVGSCDLPPAVAAWAARRSRQTAERLGRPCLFSLPAGSEEHLAPPRRASVEITLNNPGHLLIPPPAPVPPIRGEQAAAALGPGQDLL